MKKLLALCLVVFAITGCKKEENPDDNPNPCSNPEFSVSPITGGAEVFVYSSNGHGFYEIEYGPNGFSKGSGTVATISHQHNLTGLTNGTYDIYLRGNCGSTSWSDWSAAQSFLVQGGNSSTCPKPTGLNVSPSYISNDYNLRWDDDNADYYELEYGLTGFTQGSGTKQTAANNSYYKGAFSKGNTYDFYVRANCGGSDFSPWSGPKSFYADMSTNLCQAPLNLSVYKNGGYIDYSFDGNGESNFEVSIKNAPSINSALIQLDSENGSYWYPYYNETYYFYVRGVCDNGSRTAWTGPVSIYIP